MPFLSGCNTYRKTVSIVFEYNGEKKEYRSRFCYSAWGTIITRQEYLDSPKESRRTGKPNLTVYLKKDGTYVDNLGVSIGDVLYRDQSEIGLGGYIIREEYAKYEVTEQLLIIFYVQELSPSSIKIKQTTNGETKWETVFNVTLYNITYVA